jgi:hypothetical protein
MPILKDNRANIIDHMNKKIVLTSAGLALAAWIGFESYESRDARQQLQATYQDVDTSHKLLRSVRGKYIQQLARSESKNEQEKVSVNQ